MCGFVGLFQPKSDALVEVNLERMLDVIAHRGPDERRTYVSDDRRFQCGFARLSIIDLESSHQPIVEGGGDRVLLGNGEIYNYLELKDEPAAQGYPFQTQGDMETVLPLFRAEGEACLDKLNGMFALAIYDKDARSLTLARDRLGIKPLYWARLDNGGVLFASELKALFASGLVQREVNQRAVSAYLAHGYVPAPDTLFRGVFKLPPGHWMTVDEGGDMRIVPYWRPAPGPQTYASVHEAAEVLTDLLRDSVRLQLRSDVTVGALLSGGVDSGLMVALAAEHTDRLKTFTVRFEGASVDESPLAEMVAKRYGTEHTLFDLSQDSIVARLPELAWYADEPLADASLLPNFMIEQAIKGQAKVVLNGTGGDELFAGYGRYFRTSLEDKYLKVPGWARRNVIEPLMDPFTAFRLRRAEKFETDPGGYVHDHSTYFPLPIRALIGNTAGLPEAAQVKAIAGQTGDRQTLSLMADLGSYMPEDLLALLDRTTMASSIEGRVPFLDHRLVEAALAVPPEFRTPGNRQKGLEREMARPYLPDELLNAPKQGFASPVPTWIRAGLGDLAKSILTRPETLNRGWWTKTGIESLLADPNRHGHRIYALLMLEMAVRIHVEDGLETAPTDGLEAFAHG